MVKLARFFNPYNDVLFAIVAVAAVVPLWIPEFPPLVDLPQHAAQVAALHELLSGNSFHTHDLTINWFTPYLGGYLLLYLASTVLPIMVATKLLVSLAVIALPVVSGLLIRAMGGDERLKWLAIPAGYSFALYWGFFVYLVAVPVGLALVYFTVAYEKNPTTKRSIGIAALSIALFFCHAMALGFCALISLTYLLAKNFRNPMRLIRCSLPYAAPLPIIAIWMSHLIDTDAAVREAPLKPGTLHERLVVLFTQFSGLDGAAFGTTFALFALTVLLPVLSGYRISSKPERWLPMLVGLLVYLAFPSNAQNTAYLFHRLAVFLVPLWLVMWDPPQRFRPVVFFAFLGMLGVWLAVNSNRFIEFARESAAFSRVLHKAEPGKRMAGLMVCNGSPGFAYPVYVHFASWYQAEFRGIADRSFATAHPSLVRYRDVDARRVAKRISWRPLAFRWDRDGGPSYDYFIVCAPADFSAEIFKDHVNSVELVANDSSWWLYRRRAEISEATTAAAAHLQRTGDSEH
jgi:hypothetical protein